MIVSTETVLTFKPFHKFTTVALKNFCPNFLSVSVIMYTYVPDCCLLCGNSKPSPTATPPFQKLSCRLRRGLICSSLSPISTPYRPLFLAKSFLTPNDLCGSSFHVLQSFCVLFPVWIAYLEAEFQL